MNHKYAVIRYMLRPIANSKFWQWIVTVNGEPVGYCSHDEQDEEHEVDSKIKAQQMANRFSKVARVLGCDSDIGPG